jgi:hypothetical protein
MLIGLLTGGLEGVIMGFVLAGITAVAVYCITNTVKRDTINANKWADPLSDVPSSSSNDPSQLPIQAYHNHSHGGGAL